MKSVDKVANLLLVILYRWKTYYLLDMNGLLVLVSVTTTKAFYVTKVGQFVILDTFVLENVQFSAFFFKLVKTKQLFFCRR